MERTISDVVPSVVLSSKDIAYIRVLMSELSFDDLRMILERINQNKFGSNDIVRKQILDLCNGPRTTLMLELEQQVLRIHLRKQKEMQRPQWGRVKRIRVLLGEYCHNSIPFIETTIRTKRFAHDLPFFKTIHSLLKPIHCKNNVSITFNLSKHLRKIHTNSRFIEKSWNPERKEYKIQIILRLEQVGHTTFANRPLFSNIRCYVNNIYCKLPELIFSEAGYPTPWRLNVPVDITELIDLKKNKPNTLKITFLNDSHTYIVGVFLCKKLSSKDLLEKVKKRHFRPSDVTKNVIKKSLKNNDYMKVDSFIVTLKDPLSTRRMKVPSRGKECKHLQCFDAKKFLQMNEQQPTWECPICKKQVTYKNVEVDEFFYTILQSSKVSEKSENVIFFNDGTWTVSGPIYTSLNEEEIIWMDSDEDDINENFDDEELEPKSKRFKYNPPEEKKPQHIAGTVEIVKTNVN